MLHVVKQVIAVTKLDNQIYKKIEQISCLELLFKNLMRYGCLSSETGQGKISFVGVEGTRHPNEIRV